MSIRTEVEPKWSIGHRVAQVQSWTAYTLVPSRQAPIILYTASTVWDADGSEDYSMFTWKTWGCMMQKAAWRVKGCESHGAFYETFSTKSIFKQFYFTDEKSKAHRFYLADHWVVFFFFLNRWFFIFSRQEDKLNFERAVMGISWENAGILKAIRCAKLLSSLLLVTYTYVAP